MLIQFIQSEYIAACDGRRGFISGFTGSAGSVTKFQSNLLPSFSPISNIQLPITI